MAPECFITFSRIISQNEGGTQRVVLEPGLNQISEAEWEWILEKEVAQNMVARGSLRVMADADIPQVLEEDDLGDSEKNKSLDISKLSVADANAAIAKIHDIPTLLKLQETEKRVPVRAAITRRISTLGS
jgi:hypothetical protein